jgi:DNA (cytosine-5)-methyltransferase 1
MTAERMASMKALSLFSGIGGLDLAAESCGIETAAFCEIEPYAVEVLKRRFQGIENHGDITRFTNRRLRELGGSPFLRFKCPADYDGTIDVVHGGFPCQDLSVAGKQAGLEGARSGLWFEMLRVIAECRPAFVLAENVRGAVNLALDTVYAGLVGEGYKVYPYVIPASAVGAPHQRERLFVFGVRRDVADSINDGLHHQKGNAPFQSGDRKDNGVSFGSDSGALWPTPSVHGNYNRAGVSDKSGNGLSTAVKLWPTPHRNCSNGAGAHGDGGLNIQTAVSLWRTPDANCMRGPSSEERMAWKREKGMPMSINDQVAEAERGSLWPTPCSRGDNGGGPVGLAGGTRAKKKLDEHVGEDARKKLCSGSLNPAWVEILMGFPLGWTDLDCDEPEPWPGWPALMGESQYHYEPPRTVTGCPNRAKRLKCLGNAVVPAQARPFFEAMAQIHNLTTCE